MQPDNSGTGIYLSVPPSNQTPDRQQRYGESTMKGISLLGFEQQLHHHGNNASDNDRNGFNLRNSNNNTLNQNIATYNRWNGGIP